MGIEDKQIETIIEAHSDTVTALKNERDTYREKAEMVPDLQRQLEEAKADTSLADLQAKYDKAEAAHKKEVAQMTKEQNALSEKLAEVEGARDGLSAEIEQLKAEHQQELDGVRAELDEAVKTANSERDGIQSQFDEYKAGIEAKEAMDAKAKAYRKQILGGANLAPNYIDDVMAVTKLDGIELDDEGNISGADELIEAAKQKWGNFLLKQRTEAAEVDTPPAPNANNGGIEGAHERALQIARERHERLYGKSEE